MPIFRHTSNDLGAPVPLGGRVLPIWDFEGTAAQKADNFRPVGHECEIENFVLVC